MLGDAGLLNGPLAPLGLLIVIPILMIPWVFLFILLGVLRVARMLGKDWTYKPEGYALIAWWFFGLLVLGYMRDADFPPGFW